MSHDHPVGKPEDGTRLQSVDALRTLAVFAVIVIHATPFEDATTLIGHQWDLATVLNQAARFAVPFFLIVSGYFWAPKANDPQRVYQHAMAMVKRIGLIYIVWSLFYLLPTNIHEAFSFGIFGPVKVIFWNLRHAVTMPVTTFFEGTKDHLWFLMGLLSSVVISAAFFKYRQQALLFALAIALYVVGLLGKAYAGSRFGFHVDFNFRNGPFFPLVFFVTGCLLQRVQNRRHWLGIGACLTAGGLAMHFAELYWIHAQWGTSLKQDYVLGTYFYGLGMALMALSGTALLNVRPLSSVGPLVLGIYVTHFLFIDLLEPLDKQLTGHALWELAYPVAVFCLSYWTAQMLSRFAFTQRLVT